MQLGGIIRTKRERLGLSIRGFCKICPMSFSYLSDIELGKRNPSIAMLDKVAPCLGCRAGDLLNERE